MNLSRITIGSVLVLAMTLFFFQSPQSALAYDIEIDVAPNVINIESNSVVVTVHTDIAYSLVVGASVFLNDVQISHWKADNQGNFVAKFLADDIKYLPELIIGGYNTLTLTGYDINGEAFIGSQDIKVIDVIPQGGGE